MITFDPDTHSYTIDGQSVPSVTQVLADMNFVDTTWFTEYGRTRGTYVHKLIQFYIEETLDEETIDQALSGYLSAFKRFKDEADIDTDTWTVEKPLASATLRFAGTPDFVGLICGKCAVIDLKTSVTASPWERLQTAAYHMLLTEVRTPGRMPVTHRYSLHVSEDGKYKLIEHKDRQDAQVFKAALACWHWKSNGGRK